ncbi:glycoside hydrolase family 13 protein [Nocardioides marmoriginsengisoli]|uniref:Glycoside hydrolase family 13 protein n=1 Tax=Nocardioides marmoriginsengisoli TaxID=661483 RepID=A0A3N0CS53_9ACTN|nr:glycoside hydrolase family 13 protein [Nocardioides marmoriginsengisoli]
MLHEPHHDGSELYVAESAPLGSPVRVRVRSSVHRPLTAVWLRTVEDGEPFFTACTPAAAEGDTIWWTADVRIHQPVQRYRFMLVAEDSFRWLNQAGIFDHDVTDAHDFTLSAYDRPPAWGREAVVYQIFPDRFARSAQADQHPIPEWAVPAQWGDPPIHQGPHTPLQFYGGDLDGIVEHLDHVLALGVDTIYLTPVFPGESNHRYNASTFDSVDPLLGGDAAYRRLIDAAHDRGLRVLGDLTSNHTGDTHEWFRRAVTDPASTERGFYYFAADGSHEGWKGHGTLPKLDHTCAELGERFRAVVARWLDFGLDGWRIDVANMTGRHGAVDIAHDVAREIRRTAEAARPDALVLAEHGHDATGDLDGDGWHGTMNYYGFSFPIWEWLRDPRRPVPSFGLPVDVPRRDGTAMVTAMSSFTASFGWGATATSWNILGSHDSPRIRTTTGSAALHHLAAVLQFALPGVPMIFAGDELGLEGVDGEDSRRTMPWDEPLAFRTRTREVYAELAHLRREHPALRRGGLRWVHVDADRVAFLREHPDETLLISLSRDGSELPELPEIERGEPLLVVGEGGVAPRARIWEVRV